MEWSTVARTQAHEARLGDEGEEGVSSGFLAQAMTRRRRGTRCVRMFSRCVDNALLVRHSLSAGEGSASFAEPNVLVRVCSILFRFYCRPRLEFPLCLGYVS